MGIYTRNEMESEQDEMLSEYISVFGIFDCSHQLW